jgi:hypothetical protein
LAGNVTIDLYKAGVFSRNIGTAAASSGSFSWAIPSDVPTGGDFKVRVFQGTVEDYSDGNFSIAAPVTPTVHLSAPNGGESWTRGTTATITWTSSNLTGNVTIDLYKAGALSQNIGTATATSGTKNWPVPSTLTIGSDYKVRIYQGTVEDYSDAFISVVAVPTVHVSAPNGGESWTRGTTATITWTSSNLTGNVTIDLYKAGALSRNIGTATASSGTKNWPVPSTFTIGSDYKVRIYQGTVEDYSDAVFSVVATPTPTIRVSAPNGGESWTRGTTATITWTSSNLTGNVTIDLYKAGVLSQNLGTATAASGTKNWPVPSTLTIGSDYKVRIYQGTVEDYSDAVFSVVATPTPTIQVSSPNGGETWTHGTSSSVNWTTSNLSGNVTIDLHKVGVLSRNIGTATAASGAFSWTVPSDCATGTDYKVRVYQGTTEDYSDNSLTIQPGAALKPTIYLSRTTLSFGSRSGKNTSGQKVRISNTGAGTLNWTALSDQPWLNVSPGAGSGTGTINVKVNPSGLATGTWRGTISIIDPNATNSPRTIGMTLVVYLGESKVPRGYLDTPIEGTPELEGSIPVTGWAIDDIEMAKVEIWRDPVGNESPGPYGYVYVGDAVFVDGARPDVETAYPDYPFNYQAGWGYMLLSNFLPNQGNGAYRLHAIGHNAEGNAAYLGSKSFSCNNAQAILPFGTIDTPSLGGTVSGAASVVFGWALTPLPKAIPFDGSTLRVMVDGVAIGRPVYNNYRSDLANLFRGLANANGPVGYYYLDTTGYANGVHTLAWSVRDSGGTTSGIGSRYFTISNEGAGAQGSEIRPPAADDILWPLEPTDDSGADSGRIAIRKGFDPTNEVIFLEPGPDGIFEVGLQELDRLQILLGPDETRQGFQIVGSEFRPLPIGSTFEAKTGTFSWMPGPGFVGVYEFVFQNSSEPEREALTLRVEIRPKVEKTERLSKDRTK